MIIVLGLLAALGLAIAAYQVVLRQVPIRLMAAAEGRLLALPKSAPNRFFHGRAPTHQSRQIVMPSPDLVYSNCVYDLSAGPVRFSGALPPADHYWSLSLYAHNTDNYFVLNDRQLPNRGFDVVLGRSDLRQMNGAITVESPTETGIALIRMIQRQPDDIGVIQTSQRSTLCERLTET